MNKTDILSSLDGEERILISRVMDLAQRCEITRAVVYTPFLNPREQRLVRGYCKGDFHIRVSGGYEDAERAVLAFCPCEDDQAVFPFVILKITATDGRVFSHRDYLGAILALGIKREKLGDIITESDSAFVFCASSVAEFVCLNLDKVSSSNVVCEISYDTHNFSFKRKYEDRDVTVASLRLDCIVSAATGNSREKSTALINRGLVQLNYDVAKNTSARIENGDVISVRGYGKLLVETDNATSRKGRVIVRLKYFV